MVRITIGPHMASAGYMEIKQRNSRAIQLRSACLVIKILSRVLRKPVFGISNHVQHKWGCTAIDMIEDGCRLEITDFGSGGIYHLYRGETKALISSAVTAQLICALDFAYAKSRFSHDTAQ